MGDKKNLASTEANHKIKELAETIEVCMFCTHTKGKLKARPMSARHVDEQGNVWLLSRKSSDKNNEIAMDNEVDLLYNGDKDKYLSLHGNATILYDRAKIKELWTPLAKVWFTEGVDDPSISVIKVTIKDGHYWDTKHGKMVEFAKMAAALVTGTTMDDGIEGRLIKS